MRKTIMVLMIWLIVSQVCNPMFALVDQQQGGKTTAIAELPFCALILKNYGQEVGQHREINILMDPDYVNEDNLRLLFIVVGGKYPSPVSLTIWVRTDVEQLASLATMEFQTAYPDDESIGKKTHQLVLYKRTGGREFFRYNPNHPKPGLKTVVLRDTDR